MTGRGKGGTGYQKMRRKKSDTVDSGKTATLHYLHVMSHIPHEWKQWIIKDLESIMPINNHLRRACQSMHQMD